MITSKRLNELKVLAGEIAVPGRKNVIGPITASLLAALIINDGLRELASSLSDVGPAIDRLGSNE